MNKKFILILFLLTNASISFCQVNITGTVIGKEDKLEIPGVSIVVKENDKIGITTDINGKFSLNVPDSNVVLIVSFIGMKSKEVELKGQTHLTIFLKTECFIDAFDHQLIGFYLNSGVINNPIGGQFHFSFPAFFRATTLKTGIGYQTNLDKNEFINAQVEFNHVIFNCDVRMDLKWFYHKFSDNDNLNSTSYSFESHVMFFDIHDWNIDNIGLIVGYGENSFENINKKINAYSIGPTVGLRAYLGNPLHMKVYGKASIYSDIVEYQVGVSRYFRKFSAFVKYYQLDSFTELSLGIGIDFNYKFKRQRM
jgi:hypothetical protein